MMNVCTVLPILSLFSASIAPPPVTAANPLLPQIRVGLSANEFVEGVLVPFDALAGKQGVLKVNEMRQRQAIEAAALRANAIGALLRYDLDNDQHVTIAEIYAATGTSAPSTRVRKNAPLAKPTQAERLMRRYDANHDGDITLTEAAQAAAAEDRPDISDQIVALLDSNLAKDGKLTRAEVKAFAQRTFKAIDADKNGRISSEEYAVLNVSDAAQLAALR